jgi:hypothetical protein
MKICNTEEMLKNELYADYDYDGHRWINEKLPCGCIHALCLDIEPNDSDTQYVTQRILKVTSLKTIIKELANSGETDSEKINNFMDEMSVTQNELTNFLRLKRKEYGLYNTIDFDGETYYIKLKKGHDCNLS